VKILVSPSSRYARPQQSNLESRVHQTPGTWKDLAHGTKRFERTAQEIEIARLRALITWALLSNYRIYKAHSSRLGTEPYPGVFSLVGLGTCRLCCFVVQSQYLAEVSNTFPMKISLLLFSAEPGFVTISFRHNPSRVSPRSRFRQLPIWLGPFPQTVWRGIKKYSPEYVAGGRRQSRKVALGIVSRPLG
jgi:hypothetical protein